MEGGQEGNEGCMDRRALLGQRGEALSLLLRLGFLGFLFFRANTQAEALTRPKSLEMV